ncbi:Endonuclease/exonuclease/phosphatase family metal-dependent hydrolase OS=Streptomyces albaduncus OX=68172 GN=FHS32_003377 PE=4 SV=1 [Streptomyces griseoloalbus]
MATTELLPGSRTDADGSAVVRVLSYNIRSMKDDTAALARVIGACAPDLVLLQEAPRFFRWRKKLSRLASDSGLVILSGGATAAGPALLCSLRATVERTEDVLLPLSRGSTGAASPPPSCGSAAPGSGCSAATCPWRSASGTTRAGCCWSGWPGRAWSTSSRAGTSTTSRPGAPSVALAGTLTDCRTAAPWGGEHTWTHTDPPKRIDALFVTKGVEVLGCGVPTTSPG